MTEEKKWTEFPLEALADIDALAEVIAAFLNSDDTEPTGGDRSKWLSDAKLRELESKVVQTECQYGKFAELCHMASARLTEPYGRALLLLGVLNGERRKLGDRDDDVVSDLIRRSAEVISALPKGDRKDRLDGLLDYHMGIYARVVGDYHMAAECQRKSAEKAEKAGDVNGMAISTFCEAVERVSAELVAGLHPGVKEWLLGVLSVTGKFMDYMLQNASDPASARWREFNLPCHMITSFFWADKRPEGAEEFVKRLEQYVSVPANSAHKPMLVLCHAIESANLQSADDVWNGRVLGELQPVYKATAGLLLARFALRGRQHVLAAEYYNAVIKMDGPIHVVRAIAIRELVSLNNLHNKTAVTDDGSKL